MAGKRFPMFQKTTTCEQFELLISEIEKNPELAQRTDRLTTFHSRGKWEEIAEKLNAIGPPQRKISEWKKVYFDFRLRVTRKYDDNRTGRCGEIPLTSIEKSLLRALKVNEAAKRKYDLKSPSPEVATVTRHAYRTSPTNMANINKSPSPEIATLARRSSRISPGTCTLVAKHTRIYKSPSPEVSAAAPRTNRTSSENFTYVEIKLETNSPTSSAPATPEPITPPYKKRRVQSPPLISGLSPPVSAAPEPDNVPHTYKKTSSRVLGNNLFRRQLQNQSEYLDVTRDLVEVMSSQRTCLEELVKTAQIHAKLMEQQIVLQEKQTVAMERQATALERMASL